MCSFNFPLSQRIHSGSEIAIFYFAGAVVWSARLPHFRSLSNFITKPKQDESIYHQRIP